MTSKLQQLHEAGQAVWLDFVDRKFLKQSGLKKLVAEDGLTGVTSNPAIFEKAMGSGDTYDDGFQGFLGKADASVQDVYENEAIADIKAAAGDLRPVYDRLDGRDGYVSLEVSPYLANGTETTIEEARRLWEAVAEAQPDGKGSRHQGRRSRDPPTHRRRAQHQRDAAVLA